MATAIDMAQASKDEWCKGFNAKNEALKEQWINDRRIQVLTEGMGITRGTVVLLLAYPTPRMPIHIANSLYHMATIEDAIRTRNANVARNLARMAETHRDNAASYQDTQARFAAGEGSAMATGSMQLDLGRNSMMGRIR